MISDPLLAYSWFPESENLYLSHLHEVVLSFLFYQILSSYVAPKVNELIFKKPYENITDEKAKIDFDIHTVSMVQCILSIILALPSLQLPFNLNVVTYQDDFSSLVAALTVGYFIWDCVICVRYYKLYGLQFLIHALVSLYVFGTTLLPFCQPWIGKFLLFEASTPFVNINWYIIQLTKMSEKLQKGSKTIEKNSKPIVPVWFNVFNGVILMFVFFTVRILWGFSAVAIVVYEMYKIRDQLPMFLSVSVILLNSIMNYLNVIWFSKMVSIARKQASSFKKTHSD
ncbi:hypothetical protein TPHA_0E00360 [Tetrapisispora phaffii CBS 4417]|uniref:TLC domain-containing protein n=1 Tax=Tetrapisispora phaffii (strain ATCC 24235 / CBS 4417 / NBRC 1672 / NRRL Y-8282 / UCD 70-5) TaxID=1071381 RepID=G8BTA4_TETPH|nr:hypothetical protein TPHA_0E00360 [Tetrapisispora phaffii CBS 4417]CCE63132.1 hypothetical protein TPHA_0E00360 [Tetrapisispora phaffii CBS 4417]